MLASSTHVSGDLSLQVLWPCYIVEVVSALVRCRTHVLFKILTYTRNVHETVLDCRLPRNNRSTDRSRGVDGIRFSDLSKVWSVTPAGYKCVLKRCNHAFGQTAQKMRDITSSVGSVQVPGVRRAWICAYPPGNMPMQTNRKARNGWSVGVLRTVCHFSLIGTFSKRWRLELEVSRDRVFAKMSKCTFYSGLSSKWMYTPCVTL